MALSPYILHGALPFVMDERPVLGDLGELDTVELDVLVSCPSMANWIAAASAAGYTKHTAVPGWSGFFVRTMQAGQEAGKALVTVAAVGTYGSIDKRKRTLSCAGQQISIGPIEKVILVWSNDENAEDPEGGSETIGKRRVPKVDDDGEVVYKTIGTPSGSGDSWNINQAILNVTDTYFAFTSPASNLGGTALTPPSAPTPPAYRWSSYSERMRLNDPYGWVLDNREIEIIIPGLLWGVTDTFAYYYPAQPD